MERCSWCLKKMPSRNVLIKHILFIHKINLKHACFYKCYGCSHTYNNLKSFRKHVCRSKTKLVDCSPIPTENFTDNQNITISFESESNDASLLSLSNDVFVEPNATNDEAVEFPLQFEEKNSELSNEFACQAQY